MRVRIRLVRAGIRLLQQLRAALRRGVLPLLAQVRFAPADREQLVHGRERRHAGRVVMARPSPARARRRRGRVARSASRSPCCRSPKSSAAPPCAPKPARPAGSSSRPGRSDGLGLLGDGERIGPVHRPGLDRVGNRKQHIEFEDRRQRQRKVGVGARDCDALPGRAFRDDLRDLIRVPRARSSSARCRCRAMT